MDFSGFRFARLSRRALAAVLVLLVLPCFPPCLLPCVIPGLHAQDAPPLPRWSVVPEKSTLRVHLGKAGWLRMLGDEHEIGVSEYTTKLAFAPASPAGGSVELAIPARGLRVLDPHLDTGKRAEVQSKMEGPEVLDLARFPEIRFVSSRVTAQGGNRYRLEGALTIRAIARDLAFELTLIPEGDGFRARGEVPVRMTWFGIEPPSAGAGSINVKDEMKIVFDLLLAPLQPEPRRPSS